MARPNNINIAPGGGGGARGVRGASGGGRVKPTLKKKLAEPSKASVKVVPASPPGLKNIINQKSTLLTTRAASGQAAKTGAKVKEQSIKAAKLKAAKLEEKKMREFMERGGIPTLPKVPKNPTRNGVTVRN
jgi:hypothetical protein